ncbi:MAG: FAD-dependent oxidoreductase [Burkholderiales bacterium]
MMGDDPRREPVLGDLAGADQPGTAASPNAKAAADAGFARNAGAAAGGADAGTADSSEAGRIEPAAAPLPDLAPLASPETGRLLLLGAGHAHLTVLEKLARMGGRRPEVTLISPTPSVVYSGMLPGFVAGHYSIEQCTIDLGPLLPHSGAQFIEGRAVRIDGANQRVQIATADGLATVPYDVLSIDTGSVMERDQLEEAIPGSRLNALFVRPIEAFAELWPQLCQIASERTLRIAVIGAGAGGTELAMAIRHRLPTSELTLLTGGAEPVATHPKKVQKRAVRALERIGINLLRKGCATISPQALLLSDGTLHECDAVILATGARAPSWLADTDLALDSRGFVAVDAQLRSTSYPNVFAAGDVATRADQPLPKSGVHAVRQAPSLADNLFAALSKGGLKRHDAPARTLNLISCGDQYAIASWGGISFEGRWVWSWKDRIDRKYVARFAGGRQ